MQPNAKDLLDTIAELALDMARLCPDCAEKANRLVSLVGQLQAVPFDRGAVQDAIAAEIADSDVSDGQVRGAAEAVIRSVREG